MRKFKNTNALTILILTAAICSIFSCRQKKEKDPGAEATDTINQQDRTAVEKPLPDSTATLNNTDNYSNDAFRMVRVKKTGTNSYTAEGEARVFEAAFSWEVEDGHNELKSGHGTDDGGAPAWGKFNFSFTVAKASENSTLHLVLFENSAKDGSRQHQLPVPLPEQ